jgi:hypothetical protein
VEKGKKGVYRVVSSGFSENEERETAHCPLALDDETTPTLRSTHLLVFCLFSLPSYAVRDGVDDQRESLSRNEATAAEKTRFTILFL